METIRPMPVYIIWRSDPAGIKMKMARQKNMSNLISIKMCMRSGRTEPFQVLLWLFILKKNVGFFQSLSKIMHRNDKLQKKIICCNKTWAAPQVFVPKVFLFPQLYLCVNSMMFVKQVLKIVILSYLNFQKNVFPLSKFKLWPFWNFTITTDKVQLFFVL